MPNDAKTSTDSATGSKGVLVQRSGIVVESPGYKEDSQLVTSAAALTYVIQASSNNGIVLEADSAQSASAPIAVARRKSALRKSGVPPKIKCQRERGRWKLGA